jgi:IclR family KDG regulon transcriptional repressor
MQGEQKETKRRGESTYHTRAVSRALQILDCFSVKDFELSVGDLHDKLGVHKSTLVRLLHSLAEERFIEQNPETDKYRLGIKTFEIGSVCLRTRMLNISALGRPTMLAVANEFLVSTNLAIRDGREIVYVDTVEPRDAPMRVVYSSGDRFGVHHTSLGKAMIAFLPSEELEELIEGLPLPALTPRTITSPEHLAHELNLIRERGYAVDDEESLPGLRCVGAPIWSDQNVVAALSASGSTLLVTTERTEEIGARVIAAARDITVQLGGGPTFHR